MFDSQQPRSSQPMLRIGGVALVVVGAFALFAQFGGALVGLLWPFFIIVPGALMLYGGLNDSRPSGEALAYLGSMATMTGLLLLYQNTTGHWSSWAYAWALLSPTAVGLGAWAYGARQGRPEMVEKGQRMTRYGVLLFAAGLILFEFVFGISGFGFAPFLWLALIALGGYLIQRKACAHSCHVHGAAPGDARPEGAAEPSAVRDEDLR
jgi:hypothetical protein